MQLSPSSLITYLQALCNSISPVQFILQVGRNPPRFMHAGQFLKNMPVSYNEIKFNNILSERRKEKTKFADKPDF
jgi:hypothetical protein